MTSRFRLAFRGGFTLNELLVVMAIIILVFALAIPAFNVITGSKSIESAENQLSSYLAIVRADAIAAQQPRGLILFEDVATRRMTAIEVYITTRFRTTDAPILELVNGRDEMMLPTGVGFRAIPTIQIATPPSGSPSPQSFQLWPTFAVIMFDGDGRLIISPAVGSAAPNLAYRISLTTPMAPASPPTAITNVQNNLGQRVNGSLKNSSTGATLMPPATSLQVQTTFGFALFDAGGFRAQPVGNQPAWLEVNAIPYLVNRYDGSLQRGR